MLDKFGLKRRTIIHRCILAHIAGLEGAVLKPKGAEEPLDLAA